MGLRNPIHNLSSHVFYADLKILNLCISSKLGTTTVEPKYLDGSLFILLERLLFENIRSSDDDDDDDDNWCFTVIFGTWYAKGAERTKNVIKRSQR